MTKSGEKIMKIIILGIVCILFSGLAKAAQVVHPDDTNVVGFVDGANVCFNNDGVIIATNECDTSAVDEGFAARIGLGAGSLVSEGV